MKNRYKILALAILALLFGCSKKPDISHDADCQKKYDALHKKYLKGKYGTVREGYNELLNTCTGTSLYEKTHWELASSYFYLKDWIEAELEYTSFLTEFPSSDSSELAKFRASWSMQKQVSIIARDQSKTVTAISGYEDFIALYPKSTLADSAKNQLAWLKKQLAEKDLYIANQYEKRDEPLAANIYYKMALEAYGDQLDKISVMQKMVHNYNLLHQFETATQTVNQIAMLSAADSSKIVPKLRSSIEDSQVKLANEKRRQKEKKQKAITF